MVFGKAFLKKIPGLSHLLLSLSHLSGLLVVTAG
jgi:hypothetical protein